MAKVWMHNGFLQVEGEKMAKSAGNFITIRELLTDWPGEVIRFAMLQTHYSKPIDWTLRRVDEARRTIGEWATQDWDAAGHVPDAVIEALADDLNTPQVLAELHRLHHAGQAGELAASLRLLGIADARRAGALFLKRRGPEVDADEVEKLVSARNVARSAKNFAEADRIRGVLAAMGVVLKDSKDGTTWEVER